MNIRYPIYEGVYRILTLQVRNRNAEHCLIPRWKTFILQPGYIPQRKYHQGESVFKRFLGPFIVKWKYIASSISHNYLYFSYGLNLFLQTNSDLTISYIGQYKEALEVRIFPKRTLPVIKRLHPVSFQQSKDVLLLI